MSKRNLSERNKTIKPDDLLDEFFAIDEENLSDFSASSSAYEPSSGEESEDENVTSRNGKKIIRKV